MYDFNLHDYNEKGAALKNIGPSECLEKQSLCEHHICFAKSGCYLKKNSHQFC